VFIGVGVLLLATMGMFSIGWPAMQFEFRVFVRVGERAEGLDGHIDVCEWAQQLCSSFNLIE